ncbi:MAG: hypothetical protein JXQ73_26510, partial [Phycisphaerae bacterium]|nr:hypothetical protein [Phycisphaerae bacterium]
MFGWLIAVLGSAAWAAGSVETVKTDAMSIGIRDGVVVSLTDLRTKEGWDEKGGELSGLRRMKGRDLWSAAAASGCERSGGDVVVRSVWREGAGECRLSTRWSGQADGDVIVTQEGESASAGLVG